MIVTHRDGHSECSILPNPLMSGSTSTQTHTGYILQGKGPEGIRVMHGVDTNLGPIQRSQGPQRKMIFSFPSPFLFPTGLELKSTEEQEFNQWNQWGPKALEGRFGCTVLQNIFKKKTAQMPAGPECRPLHLGVRHGKRVIAGHWCWFVMEQHKIFLALWTCT